MSCDFYFNKWRQILIRLENITSVDIEFQQSKLHERKLCEIVVRLTGVLSEYIAIYKEALECSQQNLQVQKTEYMNDIIKLIDSRIIELKHQIRQLEASNYQFLSKGLIDYKLTTHDIEISDININVKRPLHMQTLLEDVIHRVKERKIEFERKAKEEKEKEQTLTNKIDLQHNWWDDNDSNSNSAASQNKIQTIYEAKLVVSETTLKRRGLIALVQAHEKTRQVTLKNIKNKQKKEMWTKELQGTLNPPARYELREKSAKMIQKVLRVYFEIKRRKIENCKRDRILGINIDCQTLEANNKRITNEVNLIRAKRKEIYVKEWKIKFERLKEIYFRKRGDDISDDYRNYLTYWCKQWYEKARFFYDIPKASAGGSSLITKEEVPSPLEWLQQYEKYLKENKANKTKSALQLKWESMKEDKENNRLKKEEIKQKKLEDILKKKMMKNPNLHPGYNFPKSKRTENIIKAVDKYKNIWKDLDKDEEIAAKKGFLKEIDDDNICCEVKMEIIKSVDDEKRLELKLLKKALKNDYKRSDETMPSMSMTAQRAHCKKKGHKIKATASESIADKLEDMAMRGFLIKYPKITLQEFTGDHNFAGDDIRCSFEYASPLAGETRQLWWERCSEVCHGHHKILLVGPPGSGKTNLVHVLASLNDAVLFELNPECLQAEFLSVPYLQQLVSSVASCAKALQPSVVYVRHVERLYSSKDMAMRGFLIKYPKITLQEFTGDHNFAGDDIRCSFEYASPLAGETRQLWWERCSEVCHGHHKILLVGPPGSGKTNLVHVLASLNDAVLFELNPECLQAEFLSVPYLQQLVSSVASCAKALQPSVVYVRHVERLYSSKKLKNDIDYSLVRRFFIQKLLIRIHKTDNITIIGACTDPWMTKSSKMLKQFSTVMLMPNTSYTTVSKLLRDWILQYHQIPDNFNVQSLAYMLQGYPYRLIKTNLEEFMDSVRIVRIAAYGVTSQDVYEYFLEKNSDFQVDYEQYLKWYLNKTTFGKKERKMLKEQKEFQELVHKWQQKNKKKQKKSAPSSSVHLASRR